MRFLPPRRWFQYRLSTWFVLVGILAWAIAESDKAPDVRRPSKCLTLLRGVSILTPGLPGLGIRPITWRKLKFNRIPT